MDYTFSCTSCGQHIAVAQELVGTQANCPTCSTLFTVPPPETAPPPLPRDTTLDRDHGAMFGMDDAGDLGIGETVRSTVGLFKSLNYGFLIPFRKIFSAALLRKKAVRWVLFFGLTPFAILSLIQIFEWDFQQTTWAIEAYFCLFWALYFHSLIGPSRSIWRRAVGYALFTAFIGITLEGLVQILPVARSIFAGTQSSHFVARAFGFVFGVGVFEEACKALPLLIFGLRKQRISSIRDGVFLGFMSGLGFAAAEGVGYSFIVTAAVYEGRASFTEQVAQIIFRLMSGPIFHGALAGTVGWFIGLASTRPKPRWPIIVVGIAFMAVAHGLFDLFSDSVISFPIAVAILLIFMAYLAHGEEQTEAPKQHEPAA